jgi:hypothetical protein
MSQLNEKSSKIKQITTELKKLIEDEQLFQQQIQALKDEVKADKEQKK